MDRKFYTSESIYKFYLNVFKFEIKFPRKTPNINYKFKLSFTDVVLLLLGAKKKKKAFEQQNIISLMFCKVFNDHGKVYPYLSEKNKTLSHSLLCPTRFLLLYGKNQNYFFPLTVICHFRFTNECRRSVF